MAGSKYLRITGGSDIATLYGVYHFAKKLGVRFYIHGDTIPDLKIPFEIPDLNETHKPLFEKRGIQPFHDFPEGPDWWSVNEWKTVLSQLPKMRMNFVGLHCYPKGSLGPEPAVWIGLPEDCNKDGTVKVSDSTSWHNTQRYASYGCYRPMKTSEYRFGGSALFDKDNYGPEINLPHDFPFPKTPEQSNDMFDRSGKMLKDIFTHAKELGITTCVGTEAPLNIPKVVKDRLKALNKDPEDLKIIQELYEGMFLRIKRSFPIDYYWIWGHEGQIKEGAFRDNLLVAGKALQNVKAPFGLGICGWGWITGNFPNLDKSLPKNVAFSAISMSLGRSFVSPNFKELNNREKWAVPWFEDDGGMISPQLHVGRMRRDAVDALEYGCNGLMGLHWRTRILAPNISALAQAGWNQTSWDKAQSEPSSKSDISVKGKNIDRKINCGGPAKLGYSADAKAEKRRHLLPAGDFYRDWANAEFGASASKQIAALFTKLDGRFPRGSGWNRGPGAVTVNKKPWSQVKNNYTFVDDMAKLRPQVKGAGNLERFDYWLNTFLFGRATSKLGCARGKLDALMARINKQNDPAKKKALAETQGLPARKELTDAAAEMYTSLIKTINNSSELGTLANIEHQSFLRRKLLDGQDATMEKALGGPLPQAVLEWTDYRGTPRLILPERRSKKTSDEPLTIKMLLLDKKAPQSTTLHWCSMGKGNYSHIPLTHVARSVYTVTIPPTQQSIEYYVECKTHDGNSLVWPTTAPHLNHTVVTVQWSISD